MLIDVLFDPFDAHSDDVLSGAAAAEKAGFDGLWLYDHLAGSVHGARRVLECWTTLTAIAATVPRLAIGPLVLNVANRDPGTLAVMAATLQEVSHGRLLLGIGAGGGRDTPYADEQEALGRAVPGAKARRRSVDEASRVIEIDEVLLPTMASGFSTGHRLAKIVRLTSSFSVAASMTRSQSPNPSSVSAALMRLSPAWRSSSVMRLRLT